MSGLNAGLPPSPFWRPDPLLTALSCAAVEPALRSIVLFDASPAVAQQAGKWLAEMISLVDEGPPRVTLFRSVETEEGIWGSAALPREREGEVRAWREGWLSRTRSEPAAHVVVVDDLARASLSASRALVALVGAEVVVLERNGQSASWTPSLSWLAALSRDEVGHVSPHLLDRFALRLAAPDPGDDAVEALLARAAPGATDSAGPSPLPDWVVRRLKAAAPHPVAWAPDALRRVLSYFPSSETPGSRRPLALARLARALARLDLSGTVTAEQVRDAARLIGLVRSSEVRGSAPESRPADPPAGETPVARPELEGESAPPETEAALGDAAIQVGIEGGSGPAGVLQGPAVEPSLEQTFPVSTLETPYPEDAATVTRESYSLRLPPLQSRNASRSGGAAIGSVRAHDLRDVAVVSTVLEAAKFQRVRPRPRSGRGAFRVTPGDLRAYRRAPSPQQVLAVVLDYTALRDCEWQDALLPHLVWAYVARASVCVVQVGGRGAVEPLRAQQVTARSLLSAQVRSALEEEAGTASPLAHGLELASLYLRRVLQHGRDRVQGGQLVVLTDGRGNVPLSASHAGVVQQPVARQGVDDALRVARDLGSLSRLTRVLLHPRPQQYGSLPLELALAMGAEERPMEVRQPTLEPA